MSESARRVRPGDRVVVTGAAGGVGRHVVRALIDADCDVVAIDRTPYSEARAIDDLFALDDVEWHTLDIGTDDLAAALSEANAVVNAAAEVGLSESYQELEQSNVIGLGRLWDAAEDARVVHLIHISAGALYRPGRGLRKESDPIEPDNDYEQTKADAEAVLADQVEDTHWTILRPAHVYGPHCTSMTAGLVTLPPILGNFVRYQPGFTGGTRTNWCHVEDVAAATLAVLGQPATFGETYNVADDTPLGFGEVLTSVTEAYGLEIGPFIPFPSSTVLLAFSPVVDRDYVTSVIRTLLRQIWSRICDRYKLDTPLRPRIDRNALFYVAEDTVLDNAKLTELGWSPKWASFTEGIVDTVRWYQEHGWVPRYDDVREAQGLEGESRFGFNQELAGNLGERDTLLALEVEFGRPGRTMNGEINGMLWIDGLADGSAVEGTIELAIVKRRLRYEFGFLSDDGRAHRGSLEAHFNPLKPLYSMSEVVGKVRAADGTLVGDFDLSLQLADQIVPMLLSFRRL